MRYQSNLSQGEMAREKREDKNERKGAMRHVQAKWKDQNMDLNLTCSFFQAHSSFSSSGLKANGADQHCAK